MTFLLILLGVLLVVLGGALWLLITLKSEFKGVRRRIPATMIMVGVLIISMNGMVFYSKPGYSYLVQYPTGKQIAELRPGLHFKWWGQAIPFKKVVTVKFMSADDKAQDDQAYSGIRNSIPVRFNDAVKADMGLSARFKMPANQEQFLRMALEFRSQDNLVNGSLIPSCMEISKNSARLISAQEYIAGRGGELESAVLDQLENGMYILDAEEIKHEDTDSIGALNQLRTIENRALIRYKVSKRKKADGTLMRKKHPIADYGILVSQATVEDVNPELRFKELLGKQRDAAAQASIEKEKAKQAEYEKQRIIAEGESAKAQIQVDMEKKQITELIGIETAKKKEKVTVEKRQLELRSAQLRAQEIKVLADAEAYKKSKVMQADGALEMKLEAYKAVHAQYAQAIAGTQLVPTTYITSGSAKGSPSSLDFINIATANMAKDLELKMKPAQ